MPPSTANQLLSPKRPMGADIVPQRKASSALPQLQPRPIPKQQSPQPVVAPRQQPRSPASPARPYALEAPAPTRPSLWQRLQLPLLISAGMLAGFLVQSLWLGIGIIVIYGILALICRLESRVTFALAFISLLTVPVLLLFKSNIELASNFATYTFLLLVIGVIALSIEARPQERRRKRRNGR